MEEFLLVVFEFLLEIILEVGVNWPVAGVDPANRRDVEISLLWQCLLYALVGCGIAALSLYFFPHPWIKNPVLQLLSLIVAPCFAAFVAYWFAKRHVGEVMSASPRVRAWKSYCLTLALVLVRYTFGKHV